MDFNLLARVAKAVALLGFFLPWVTVSCSGTQLAEATGWQLMTGDVQTSGPAASQSIEDQGPAVLVILVFALIALGLLGGLLMRSRNAAGVMLASALAAIALAFFSVENMRTGMREEIARSQTEAPSVQGTQIFSSEQMGQLSRSVAQSIELNKEDGFWITIGALGAAALFALLTLARAVPPPRNVTAPPPAS